LKAPTIKSLRFFLKENLVSSGNLYFTYLFFKDLVNKAANLLQKYCLKFYINDAPSLQINETRIDNQNYFCSLGGSPAI